MSSRVRIVNTAPLIFLSKIKRLELLRLGADVVYIPGVVLNELAAVQDEAGMAVREILGTWLFEKSCSQQNLLAISRQALYAGEAEVVALALELGTMDVVLDDLDARRFARRSGLQPIGTLGLLLAGKRAGIIQAIFPEIKALRMAGFYANDALRDCFLSTRNERITRSNTDFFKVFSAKIRDIRVARVQKGVKKHSLITRILTEAGEQW